MVGFGMLHRGAECNGGQGLGEFPIRGMGRTVVLPLLQPEPC